MPPSSTSPSLSKTMAYSTRLYNPSSDAAALRPLLAENLPVGRGEALEKRLRWFYEGNPAGEPTTIVGLSEGEVVGCGSLLPRRMYLQGEPKVAGLLCDFAVASGHRSAGLAIKIQRALSKLAPERGCDFLFGSPNENAAPIFKRVGYRHVGDAARWSKPLSLAPAATRAAASLQDKLLDDPRAQRFPLAANAVRLALPTAARGAAVLAGPLGYAYDLALRGAGGGVKVDISDEPTLELASLDASLEADFCAEVRGARDSDFVRWRYCALAPKHRIVTLHRSGKVLAYAAFRVEKGQATIADLAGVDARALYALLGVVSLEARMAGAGSLSLSLLGGKGLSQLLRRAGFWLRPERRTIFVHDKALTEAEQELTRNPDAWGMLEGELDV